MKLLHSEQQPQYAGLQWRPVTLPALGERWLQDDKGLVIGDHRDAEEASVDQIRRYAEGKPWVWPNRRVCFLSDLHADADAFSRSLVATGGVRLTGPADTDMELTELGRRTVFVIGGDLFDKGPHNLRLLRMLEHFRELGAELQLLAGNHDIRTLLGIAYAGRREARFEHLFVRMGQKTMRLFKEVYDEYLGGTPPENLMSDEEFRRRYFPTESWFHGFPGAVEGLVPRPKIDKELRRIREKITELQVGAANLGMSLGVLHAVVLKCRELFLEPEGEFHWLFARMRLAYDNGSFLFVHAGVDDATAACLASSGAAGLNRWFDELMQRDLFELYHGPVGNVFRTKYRDIDFPLTERGLQDLARAGIYAIVHGHRNLRKGARLTLRGGVLNFECDASVDENTRAIEGLAGPGAAAVIFEPAGHAFSVSTDYPFVRVLERDRLLPFSTCSGAQPC